MKKFFTVIVFIMLGGFNAYAGDDEFNQEYLFDWDNLEHGGFGAFVMKYTPVNGTPSLMIGGRGGWILNHTLSIGGGGYAQVLGNKESAYIDSWNNEHPVLMLSQFGLELEYTLASQKGIHATVLFHIGGGSLSYQLIDFDEYDHNYNDNYNRYGIDWFFQMEPSVNVELNIAKWFRMTAGVGYRFASGVDYKFNGEEFKNSDISGITGNLQFKFGSF